MILKSFPLEERPREKALRNGIDLLSNAELLAIIIRTGNKQESVLQLSQRIINEIGGFNYLKDVGYNQLIEIKGIKEAKAVSVLAIIELAKRITNNYGNEKRVIKDPKDGYKIVKNKLLFENQEKVILLCLNNHLEVIKEKIVFVGSHNMSIISGREIFKEALMCNSSRIMIVHNHPSGHPDPSSEDVEVTNKLKAMGSELEIELLDHLIIGKNCFYSFASNNVYQM